MTYKDEKAWLEQFNPTRAMVQEMIENDPTTESEVHEGLAHLDQDEKQRLGDANWQAISDYMKSKAAFFEETSKPTCSPDSINPKDLVGCTKPSAHFVPPVAILALSEVMKLGAAKYGSYNFRTAGVQTSIYMSAIYRHWAQFWDGEDVDDESKQSHLAHIMACCAILLDGYSQGNVKDDRPIVGGAGAFIRTNSE